MKKTNKAPNSMQTNILSTVNNDSNLNSFNIKKTLTLK